ncbi:uncharacterized protein LOC130804633 isoform X2 [Amaranthus tricolor]|uniref:uncharacterized protein LOC130804633 isoform X2 n=1 Tax=Amaranthus tricolor TaxID=29722 RepID=UPI0025839095|nr:uncharacterized protein LOC130804633 isoform X2 [Amaranthus tricolor]
MESAKSKLRLGVVIAITAVIGIVGLYGLLKPIQNGCTMTYMYPTYIPISAPKNLSSNKYGLYLYHEGWKKIDFDQHLKQLNGVPVLFIPGNGGSYKQVRSIAKESYWAYTSGPSEHTYYKEASLSHKDGDIGAANISLPNQYASMLDWFAVDLEGEHSAMDGGILEEHAEYVVYAIHRILDQYKESIDARTKEGTAVYGTLPKSVILVGHSMGGFVARAATVHPNLRKKAVETIVTLSSPHQTPPVALQPSLGYYYASINQKWQEGYHLQVSNARSYASHPMLSHVVVISISGGVNDYQVRSKLETLDGIVPPSHGFMISSTEMKNVWLSMEHQAILWCNQLVVQVSHTLLSLVDPETGNPFTDTQKRLAIFTKMLHGGLRHSSDFVEESYAHQRNLEINGDGRHSLGACPKNIQWDTDSLERDLYIQTPTVTVLAMDGRRRWLDIQKLGSNGKSHFVLVSNLSPCSGVRIHLWPEKQKSFSNLPLSKRVVEVTSTMAQIPSGPAPRQIEPGSQTEQPPPSAVFWLSPEAMQGFRFITISVAPRPTVSGRPPPAASMAVGQFFKHEEGVKTFSPLSLLKSVYSQNEILFKEDHPIALNLSFTISLGLLPVTVSLKTTGCGIKNSELSAQKDEDAENSRLCKMRCFPAVALAWDRTSGLHIYPNLISETVTVDSAPALWNSAQGSEKTTVMLLVDPHCAYKASFSVSATAAASRFLLLYCSKIVGLAVAIVFFALMRQAHAWELGMPIPSMLTAVECNMKLSSFPLLTAAPLLIPLVLSVLQFHPIPSISSFIVVSLACYMVANGLIVVLVLISQFVFYISAFAHVFFKNRLQVCKGSFCLSFLQQIIDLVSRVSTIKVVRVVRSNPALMTILVAIVLVCFVHPALGLSILLISHSFCCHSALCSRAQRKESLKDKDYDRMDQYANQRIGRSKRYLPLEENHNNTGGSPNSFSDIQLEIFHQRHGLLILHLLAMLMFAPSFVAWLQRLGIGQNFPWFLDSVLCVGVILHGICDSNPEFNFFVYHIPGVRGLEVRLSYVYLLAGYFSFLSGLALAPYRVFYAMATIGALSLAFRIVRRKSREKGEAIFNSRKHSHRH